MEELEKDFVPHDRALRMKALGFDEPCFGVFELIIVGDTIPKFRYNFDSEGKWFNHNKVKDEYNNHDWYWSAPTFSQAINFLYICSNKQIDIELKASDTYEERLRKIDQGCEDLWNLQNSKSN